MFLRKLGKSLLGKATPFQVYTACALGGALGFCGDFARAPGLTLFLLLLLFTLNTNLFLAALVTLASAAVSILLLPVSFHVGRLLVDGPTQALFEWAINTPVLALFGFEYYAITGGLVLGLVLGGAAGLGLMATVRKARAAFLKYEAGSEKFRAIAAKRRVRIATWVLLGTTPSREVYEKLAKKRVGNPVRIWGVAVAVAGVVGIVLLVNFLAGPFLASKLRAGLERANGATVDLAGAAIDLGEGRVSLDGLAMADPNNLPTDIFRSVKVEADLSGADLLRKRLRFEKIVVDLAASGVDRDEPGRRTDTAPVPQEGGPPVEEEYKTIDDYVEEARVWRERLAQLRRWLEELAPGEAPEGEREEKLEEKLRRMVREKGYAWAAAEHLIRGAPTLLISELRIERLQALQLGGKQLNIVGENLSTQPHLAPGPARLTVRSEDGTLLFEIGPGKDGSRALDVAIKGLSGDAIGAALKAAPVAGGTVDLAVKGTWEGAGAGAIDLDLDVLLAGTSVKVPGAGGAKRIDRLELPLAVRGTFDDPRVLFREEDLAKALMAAGQKELANRVADEAGERLGEDAKKKLGELFGGKK